MFLQRSVCVCVLDAISAYVIKQISIEFLLIEHCFHYSSTFFSLSFIKNRRIKKGKKG